MFPLIESIKILDGIPQHLSYHQHRFEASYFKLYKSLPQFRLENLIEVPDNFQKGLVKLRFLYNQNDCFCQYDFYKYKPINSLKLVVDNQIDYSLKWVNRTALEDLLKQKASADDILIVKNNRLTDTSFSNIVFYDGVDWVTPKFPLLFGTARNRLLTERKIKAKDILIADLQSFKSFKLINAMRDFEQEPEISIHKIIL